MKNLILQTFHLCLFLGAALVYGQGTVGGVVTDGETGTPLPGVNVLIQGTTTGVSTDFDGNYSIQAEDGQVLEFSYLGFEVQTITVSGDQLDVSLQPSTNFLDEIVVTGYGTQSRREVTAADVDVDFILDERARELVGEGHRWFDLVRTGKLIERVKAHNIDGSPNIQSHHVLRPIPLDQIDRTEGGYGQNAGYTQ